MGEGGGGRKQNVVDSKLLKALEDTGYSPEEIARATSARAVVEEEQRCVVVEPENADAVRLFRQMQTQWRIQTVNVFAGKKSRVLFARTGLDYGAIAPLAAALRIDLSEDAMDRLRLLEAETLAIHLRRQEQLLQRS